VLHAVIGLRRLSLILLAAAVPLVLSSAAQAQPGKNLIYNAMMPCRLIDTRIAGGALVAGTSRTFNAVGVSAPGSLASQGGNPNGCPIPGFVNGFAQVQALAINLVAVGPAGAGDLVAWESDDSQPAASVINYMNTNIANMVILPVRQDFQGNDITVRPQVSGTHLVADVVGYFTDATPTAGAANLVLGTAAGNIGAASGTGNVAYGSFSLLSLTTGSSNSALGDSALMANAGGGSNTAVGANALSKNTTGNGNVALGAGAGSNIVAGSHNVDVGNTAPGDESNTIRIGDTAVQTAAFIAGINGATSSSGTAVFVNASGQLGTTTSSLRFKQDVRDMGEASGDLMKLRPVTFRYTPGQDDGSQLLQYGLIAEEVAQVYPGLVQLDAAGKPLAVRYHFVNAMLLNEVQRQHRTIEDQRAKMAELEARLADQRRQAESQEARLRRLESLLDR
jgi:Chaperone of endosialidase